MTKVTALLGKVRRRWIKINSDKKPLVKTKHITIDLLECVDWILLMQNK